MEDKKTKLKTQSFTWVDEFKCICEATNEQAQCMAREKVALLFGRIISLFFFSLQQNWPGRCTASVRWTAWAYFIWIAFTTIEHHHMWTLNTTIDESTSCSFESPIFICAKSETYCSECSRQLADWKLYVLNELSLTDVGFQFSFRQTKKNSRDETTATYIEWADEIYAHST